MASTIVAALEPGPTLPLRGTQEQGPSLAEVVDSFVDVRRPETAALAAENLRICREALEEHP